ncbi:MAG: alpha/beta hydrolase [Hyphomonas sp.]|nr:alpha/beta hydrolase [Hyphomonas sp.]
MLAQSIIFLPGFMCDERLFRPQIETLSRHGISCRVGDLTGACSIERLASIILRNAPKRFALAGLSMGGIVAFEVCKQAPERVTHLALLNTTARADAAGLARKKQLGRVAAGELDLVLREELKPQYLAPANRTTERLRVLEQMGVDLGKDVFCRQTMALTVRDSYLDSVRNIQCPTLLLAGAEDTVCPVDRHEEISARIPHAHLKVLARCGHISTLEQPALVSQALLDLLDQPQAHTTRSGNCSLKLVKNTN